MGSDAARCRNRGTLRLGLANNVYYGEVFLCDIVGVLLVDHSTK